MRLNGSLKRQEGGFVLDLTGMKMHKTSRFHGPSITTVSPLLTEQLTAMCDDLTWDHVEEDKQAYLWHVKSDSTRPVSSSAFSTLVKNAFARHAPGNKPTPPKVCEPSQHTCFMMRL